MTRPKTKAHTDSRWLFDTMAQCASFTGTPLEVLKSAKRAGCMGFKLGNRVDYLEFLKWHWAKAKTTISELPDGFASWKEVLESEKAKRESIKRQHDEGAMMPTADAVAQAGVAGGHFMSELERMARELPPSLAGLSAVDVHKRMSSEVESIRKTLTEKLNEIGK